MMMVHYLLRRSRRFHPVRHHSQLHFHFHLHLHSFYDDHHLDRILLSPLPVAPAVVHVHIRLFVFVFAVAVVVDGVDLAFAPVVHLCHRNYHYLPDCIFFQSFDYYYYYYLRRRHHRFAVVVY